MKELVLKVSLWCCWLSVGAGTEQREKGNWKDIWSVVYV